MILQKLKLANAPLYIWSLFGPTSEGRFQFVCVFSLSGLNKCSSLIRTLQVTSKNSLESVSNTSKQFFLYCPVLLVDSQIRKNYVLSYELQITIKKWKPITAYKWRLRWTVWRNHIFRANVQTKNFSWKVLVNVFTKYEKIQNVDLKRFIWSKSMSLRKMCQFKSNMQTNMYERWYSGTLE